MVSGVLLVCNKTFVTPVTDMPGVETQVGGPQHEILEHV